MPLINIGNSVLGLTLLAASSVLAEESYPPLDILLSSTISVLGQPIEYPKGQAKITAAIVTMQPGASTGRHKHDVPLFAYILEGEISVDYGVDGEKTYTAGDSFIEAFQTEHDGRNTGTSVARILAVFAGAEGTENTVKEE